MALLVAIEGIDGSGKGTQAGLLTEDTGGEAEHGHEPWQAGGTHEGTPRECVTPRIGGPARALHLLEEILQAPTGGRPEPP